MNKLSARYEKTSQLLAPIGDSMNFHSVKTFGPPTLVLVDPQAKARGESEVGYCKRLFYLIGRQAEAYRT